MKYPAILILILPPLVLGLNQKVLKLGVTYFNYREVKFVCLLSCNNDISWKIPFTKLASNFTIAVSTASIEYPTDFNRIEKCLHQKMYSIGVVIDASCNETEDVMYYASEHMWLDSKHNWLIINNDDGETENCNDTNMNTIMFDKQSKTIILEVLDNLNISVDADIVLAAKNSSEYILYDVFNFGKIQGGNLMVNNVGSWNRTNSLHVNVNLNEYKYYRRWNFSNISLRMILVNGCAMWFTIFSSNALTMFSFTVNQWRLYISGDTRFPTRALLAQQVQPAPKYFDPEQISDLKPMRGVAVITQISASIFYVIANMHNFRYTHTLTDRWIGTYERNKTRVVCSSLYFREQDVSPVIRFLSSVHEKIDIINPPLTSIETRYYYLIPTTGPGKFENQFLRPLSPTTWWCVIGVSALCAVLLLLSALLERRPSSFEYAIFSVVASICQQSRKVTILVTGLSCVLLYNYYTSSVVSWLLNGPPPSIKSLKELLESPLELIYEDVGYTRSWLQTPTYYYNKRNAKIEDELRQKKVFNKKKDAPLLEPLVQGIRMVQKGGYAYHTEVNSANALIAKTFTQTELCELGSLQSIEKTTLFPCLQKNSPYKEFITWSLLRLLERGIVSCIQIRRESVEVKCEGSSPRPLALGGAAPAFILLAGGYILATMIMMFERFVYKKKHQSQNYL